MSQAVRNKQRGKELERELVKFFIEHGLKAERAWGSNGKTLGRAETVDVLVEKETEHELTIQAKRVKKLAQRYTIDDDFDCVIFRQDHGQPMIMLPLKDFMEYYLKGRQP